MRLSKFSLENYRSFKSRQTFETDGGISILVGPNGGGKSNLLDTTLLLLRQFVFPSWVLDNTQVSPERPLPHFARNDTDLNAHLVKHNDAKGLPQHHEIEIEVTARDIANLQAIVTNREALTQTLNTKYAGLAFPNVSDWAAAMPEAGQKFTVSTKYQRKDERFEQQRSTYLHYLQNFDWLSRIQAETTSSSLTTPILSLPAARNSQGLSFSASLAGYTELNVKKGVDMLSSKMPNASITQFAVGRLAERYLDIFHQDQGNSMSRFMETEEAQGLSNGLATLGYSWKLKTTNQRNNSYAIELTKAGRSFSPQECSSGEKEILIYLFAIFGLGVRDAVVFIDEPELHLHPRLQKKLFALFEELVRTTGNQFILATHSPVFISPASIQYVSRVFNEVGESKILRLNDANLPNSKHLFNIVNSQNNEALFFADHVLLVEGLSDKIFFEKVLERFLSQHPTTSTIEVIAVGGKGLFNAYVQVLVASKVPFSIIADQDYLEQIGSQEIKQLQRLDVQGIKKHVVEDGTSRDGKALVDGIEKAIHDGSWDHAADIWNYIKSRRLRIKPELTDDERRLLTTFVTDKRSEGIYVLSLGALESYLPESLRSKDMEKLIRYLEEEEFWENLPAPAAAELQEVFLHFLEARVKDV